MVCIVVRLKHIGIPIDLLTKRRYILRQIAVSELKCAALMQL